MSAEEKGAWIAGVVAIGMFGTYLSIILSQGVPLTETAYVWPMIWSIVGASAATVVLHILAASFWPKDAGKKDVRDKQIARFGNSVGNWFVIAGALAAMTFAMKEWNPFWIANVLFLGFVLSAILSTVVKVITYRGVLRP